MNPLGLRARDGLSRSKTRRRNLAVAVSLNKIGRPLFAVEASDRRHDTEFVRRFYGDVSRAIDT